MFARSDIVVLPYNSAAGSGVIPVAYHYNKPVVVSRAGGLPDVVLWGKAGYIVSAGGQCWISEDHRQPHQRNLPITATGYC